MPNQKFRKESFARHAPVLMRTSTHPLKGKLKSLPAWKARAMLKAARKRNPKKLN